MRDGVHLPGCGSSSCALVASTSMCTEARSALNDKRGTLQASQECYQRDAPERAVHFTADRFLMQTRRRRPCADHSAAEWKPEEAYLRTGVYCSDGFGYVSNELGGARQRLPLYAADAAKRKDVYECTKRRSSHSTIVPGVQVRCQRVMACLLVCAACMCCLYGEDAQRTKPGLTQSARADRLVFGVQGGCRLLADVRCREPSNVVRAVSHTFRTRAQAHRVRQRMQLARVCSQAGP
jgi:hypothetical protein